MHTRVVGHIILRVTKKQPYALNCSRDRTQQAVQAFIMVAPFTVPQFYHRSLPFEIFAGFLLLPGYSPNCKTQHSTESALQILSWCDLHLGFQPQGTHKPFYSACLQIPYLLSVESHVLNFHDSIMSSWKLNVFKIKWNCPSSLIPSRWIPLSLCTQRPLYYHCDSLFFLFSLKLCSF